MSGILASGSARVLGDDINTDYIVPSHRKKETIDPHVLRAFVFEDIHPGFHDRMDPETILIAGTNFGCGSAMEVAVTVLQAAGVKAVVAKSFSRTFRRNALNNGLLLCQADATDLTEGCDVRITVQDEVLTIGAQGRSPIYANRLPDFMAEMLRYGGLAPFLRARGGFS
jgi:3-isopropylmalate/(R)-2-methylmalate dehydratase small subunit